MSSLPPLASDVKTDNQPSTPSSTSQQSSQQQPQGSPAGSHPSSNVTSAAGGPPSQQQPQQQQQQQPQQQQQQQPQQPQQPPPQPQQVPPSTQQNLPYLPPLPGVGAHARQQSRGHVRNSSSMGSATLDDVQMQYQGQQRSPSTAGQYGNPYYDQQQQGQPGQPQPPQHQGPPGPGGQPRPVYYYPNAPGYPYQQPPPPPHHQGYEDPQGPGGQGYYDPSQGQPVSAATGSGPGPSGAPAAPGPGAPQEWHQEYYAQAYPGQGQPGADQYKMVGYPQFGRQIDPSTGGMPPLVRTTALSQAATSLGSGNPAVHGGAITNPDSMLTSAPYRASLEIASDLDAMTRNWTMAEWQAKRRLVQFRRAQRGPTITAEFFPLDAEDYTQQTPCISCIHWEERGENYVTSVDCIYLLEQLVNTKFTVEEKNRIRRNLEGYHPLTVSKGRPESGNFFRLIMSFSAPKPRNIEKDVKVFPWKTLAQALKKIISKYSADYGHGPGAAGVVGTDQGHMANQPYNIPPRVVGPGQLPPPPPPQVAPPGAGAGGNPSPPVAGTTQTTLPPPQVVHNASSPIVASGSVVGNANTSPGAAQGPPPPGQYRTA